MGGLKYIRDYYHVPAFRGARVEFTDHYKTKWTGKITSSNGAYLRILVDDRVDGYRGRKILHPTWNVRYL
jgi:hypothetical protein